MDANTRPPATATGRQLFSKVPLPSAPSPPYPQQKPEPFAVRPHECHPPVATETKAAPIIGAGTGTAIFGVPNDAPTNPGFPACPKSSPPQQEVAPPAVTPQECHCPAVIAVKSTRATLMSTCAE